MKILTARIMHECVRTLIVKNDAESLHHLCSLLSMIGEKFEKETEQMIAEVRGYKYNSDYS